MKAQQANFGVYLLMVMVIIGCQTKDNNDQARQGRLQNQAKSSIENLPKNEAGEIVKKAIEQAGGWEKWEAKNSLQYTKIIQFYDSMGDLQREESQLHRYRLQPHLKMNISWEEGDDKFTTIYDGQEAYKMKNGKAMTEKSEINAAWNSSFGSQYVMCMPFKLADPGTVLKYEGLDTLNNGRIVHSIKTTYKKGAGSAAGQHTWWYFFDRDDFSPVANFLDYGDGYSYTQYDEFVNVEGVKVNRERKSYKTDGAMNLGYVTAVYRNENILFDIKLETELFEVKK